MKLEVLYILPEEDDPIKIENTVLHYLFEKKNILPRVGELISILEFDTLLTVQSIQYGIYGRTKEHYITIWLEE